MSQLSTKTFLFRNAPEMRAGCFVGHLNTPGIPHPLPEEQLLKRPLPAQAIVKAVHESGGAVIYSHPLSPPYQLHWMGAAEIFSDAVLGQCADAFEVDSKATELLWFAVLNLSNKVACSASTDSTLERLHTLVPGDRRVYCQTKEFSYRAIVQALRQGHTFATNGGPLFPFFTIDGHDPGDTITPGPDRTYTARMEIHRLYPLKSAELYRRGNVVKIFEVMGKKGETILTHAFQETKKSWYVLRVEDERGYWAITSQVYFELPHPSPRPFAGALLFEISNCTRFIQLRREYFAHLIVTVSPDDRLTEVHLLRDGQAIQRFTPDKGNEMSSGKIPVTELDGEYHPGWIWHPEPARSAHFQADWPLKESGWYQMRATTAQGHLLTSDAVYFDVTHPNSHELSVAHLMQGDTRLALWGYGEEMPLSDIHLPFEGDHWWYPASTFWRLKATFGEKTYEFKEERNRQAAGKFKSSQG